MAHAAHTAPPSAAHHGAAEEHHSSTGLSHRKLLMWVFLGSDCLFFGALIAVYMVYRNQSINGPYPIDIISIPVTTVSTFMLLMSSFSMVQAVEATRRNAQTAIKLWLLATVLMGAIFIGFQVYEFNEFRMEGLTPQTNLFGATFFTLTGFHGAHVTLGLIWLLGLFVVGMKGRLGPQTYLDVDIAGLYWHFVDIVWIIIFTLVYLIGGFDSGPSAAALGSFLPFV